MKMLFIPLVSLLICGCATTSSDPSLNRESQDKLEKARAIIKDAIPYIRASAAAAIRVSLQYAEKEPDKREILKAKVNVVAIQLEVLLNQGNFKPEAVTDALKVKEEYVDSILEAVAIIYSATYSQLEQSENASLSIQVLKALAQGARDGTQ